MQLSHLLTDGGRLFRTYKEIPQPFWGFVYDMDDLESKLMIYLEERSRNASTTSKSSRPVTASWLAILFAVLAVGSQYHESPYHIRTRDSQKYIQISFHFLRLGNFLLRYVTPPMPARPVSSQYRPSFDSIQALLLTSFVLLNDMKAEASWALTGLHAALRSPSACIGPLLTTAAKMRLRTQRSRKPYVASCGGPASGMTP